MTYQSIATRYRPKSLTGLIGQDAAVKVVQGMLASGRINQTMMISGPFGLGKTTLARLSASPANRCDGARPHAR